MKNMKNTKTLENLMKAFAGESQARNRYTYYASVARKEGYRQIEGIFLETADNEKEHAKRFFKLALEGTKGENPMPVDITASYPLAYGNTSDNLLAAAQGENEEWTILYTEFADVAKEEGFTEVEKTFRNIALVEEKHEKRYRKLLENIETETVYKKETKVFWKCRNCGFIIEATTAPDICPACLHPQEHFEVLAENY